MYGDPIRSPMRAPASRPGYVVTWASDGEICDCGISLPYNTRDLVLDHFISAAADGRLGSILAKMVCIPRSTTLGRDGARVFFRVLLLLPEIGTPQGMVLLAPVSLRRCVRRPELPAALTDPLDPALNHVATSTGPGYRCVFVAMCKRRPTMPAI